VARIRPQATLAGANPDRTRPSPQAPCGAGATLTSGQTLTADGGSKTLIGYSGFGDTFSGTSAGLNGDTIQLFGGSDKIDLTDLGFGSATTLAYQRAVGLDTLTASDGTHTAKINFVGDYTVANFHLASDTHGGSLVSFVPA
jgi:hypothetical protein